MPSGVIASFEYSIETEVLCITFVSGIVYHYQHVPANIFEGLKNSRAKGIFFNQAIKDHYAFDRVSRP